MKIDEITYLRVEDPTKSPDKIKLTQYGVVSYENDEQIGLTSKFQHHNNDEQTHHITVINKKDVISRTIIDGSKAGVDGFVRGVKDPSASE